MNFEEALESLKDGDKITNLEWNGKGMYLEVQFPNHLSKMTHPYIYICDAKGELLPWTPSQTDLFSKSWSR